MPSPGSGSASQSRGDPRRAAGCVPDPASWTVGLAFYESTRFEQHQAWIKTAQYADGRGIGVDVKIADYINTLLNTRPTRMPIVTTDPA